MVSPDEAAVMAASIDAWVAPTYPGDAQLDPFPTEPVAATYLVVPTAEADDEGRTVASGATITVEKTSRRSRLRMVGD